MKKKRPSYALCVLLHVLRAGPRPLTDFRYTESVLALVQEGQELKLLIYEKGILRLDFNGRRMAVHIHFEERYNC